MKSLIVGLLGILVVSYFTFPVYGENQSAYLIVKAHGDKLISDVKSGYLKEGVFVQDGATWSFVSNKFEKSVTLSKFKDGVQVGTTQHYTSGSLLNPLLPLVSKIGVDPIKSDEFAKIFFANLKKIDR